MATSAAMTLLEPAQPALLASTAWLDCWIAVTVGSGSTLLLIALLWAFAARRRAGSSRGLLIAIALGAPLALVALEAGWFVTEFGRQPWIARGLLRTADAVTTATQLDLRFFGFSLIYVVLAAMSWWLLVRVGRSGAEH